ncbi:MAG: mannose-1-phosphate guanylyltransferase/mannose-6-phosphate isomerase [Thermodesulfovibrionales bacterium]|nr:mannose-1-phosphate guanylyltransferase/mannose-6-phosphate isomerase [Thermodesulfovibrionales bacterium]
MKAMILAGGGGTRLWPLSRQGFPKQFLKLINDKSLLQITIERLLGFVNLEDMIISTNRDYKFYVLSDLSILGNQFKPEQILMEPISKNTAPAIALGIKYLLDTLGCSKDDVLLVCPADHVISPKDKFSEYLNYAETLAKEGQIVVFGLKPTRADTGYGYIKAGEEGIKINEIIFPKVERFVEKPDFETARSYLNSGDYYWNSGIFVFRIDVMLKELNSFLPQIASLMKLDFQGMIESYAEMPNISIDYGVIEKSSCVSLVPMDLHWNDIGSWDALFDELPKDENGNTIIGDVQLMDTNNCLFMGSNRHISAIGIEDCIIIDTPDALLISKKGHSQKVSQVVASLKDLQRPESEEHLTCHRPWGSFTTLEEGHRYKIKRIVVQPNEKLSLQMHHHRSEHWVVIKGTARVTIGDKEIYVHENESVFVPKTTLHRLENPGKVPLEIIEVQNGEYVGEDDIIRFEDKYER